MNEQFHQLVNFITEHMHQGVSEEAIRASLNQYNYSELILSQAFAEAFEKTRVQSEVPFVAPTNQPPVVSPVSQTPVVPQNEPVMPVAPAQPPVEPQAFQPVTYPATAPTQPAQVLEAPASAGSIDLAAVSGLPTPEKYTLRAGIADAIKAIQTNFATFIISTIAVYAIAIAGYVLLGVMTTRTLGTDSFSLGLNPTHFIIGLIEIVFFYVAWGSVSGALLLTTTSRAVMDGANGLKVSIKQTISEGISKIGRTLLATVLYELVVTAPLIIGMVIGIVYAIYGPSGTSAFLIVPIVLLVSFIWLYIAVVRYGLTTFVAMFEPDLPLLQTLGRSKKLLFHGGQAFIFKGGLLLIGLVVIYSVATHQSFQSSAGSFGIVGNIVVVMLGGFINAVLVVLYRNRRVIRG